MIGSLRGVVVDRLVRSDSSAEMLVEVGGVGYRVTVPTPALADAAMSSEVLLHVHTHVREDAIVLFGFPTREERRCFEALIGAHGVGPSVALALLSVHGPGALRQAVATEDIDALTLVPGIGPKTAARLVVELQSRLDVALDDEPVGRSHLATGGAPARAGRDEVRVALAGLGYAPDEIRWALGALPEDGTVEELLRLALRELAGAR
jgi:Holliday junction DNA helicase RuvA